MTDQLFLAESELPPKPDPDTGEPRPPQAPGYHVAEKSKEKRQRDRETNPAKAPTAPAGEGPMLIWYKSSRKAALKVTAWGTLIIPIVVILMQGLSIEWMSFWQPWAVLAAFLLLIYLAQRTVECAAGAEWIKHGKAWVRLYELTDVKVKHRSNSMHLDLKDRHGHTVMTQLDDIQQDREMWDLVYNGILHSVITGQAKTNGMVHSALKVPRPANWQP